jgi:pimeloyl-ACP methyl ester carboxylesterase
MDIVLVPGLWLDGATWNAVVPRLVADGHRTFPLTLPGMEAAAADRSRIVLADHVNAVVEAIDSARQSVVLVGHSAGCAIAHCAVDVRPERVARIVHVGGFPVPAGGALADGLAVHNGEVSMPDWEEVGETDMIADFSKDELARFYAQAIPSPAQVVAGPVSLSDDERKYEIPATVVCTEYTSTELQHWLTGGEVPELARIKDLTLVDLPGGHWPQVTQPQALASVILQAVREAE